MKTNVFTVGLCSFAFQYPFWGAQSRPMNIKEIENKNIHKETGEFPNQSHSIYYSMHEYIGIDPKFEKPKCWSYVLTLYECHRHEFPDGSGDCSPRNF